MFTPDPFSDVPIDLIDKRYENIIFSFINSVAPSFVAIALNDFEQIFPKSSNFKSL